MKKVFLIILSLVMVLCISACGTKDNDIPTNSVYTPETVGLSREAALEKAKQEVVNKICQANNVSRITLSYGTETINSSGGGDWSVTLKGTYRTANDYGEVDYSGDRKRFSYSGTVRSSGSVFIHGSCK